MCGILAIFEASTNDVDLRKRIVSLAKRLRHRGPDASGVEMIPNGAIAHERLSIIDPESGSQPLLSTSKGDDIILAVNGEIYNHEQLKNSLKKKYEFSSDSDCEVLIPLYLEHGADFISMLDGMFGFVLYDRKKNTYVAGRDYMGIIPLYVGWRADGGIMFSSELKGLKDDCVRFQCFPPGHLYSSSTSEFVQWYQPTWQTRANWPLSYKEQLTNPDYSVLREAFENAVTKRLMSDVPWGVLLSGGLDSSLVASVAVRHFARQQKEGKIAKWGSQIHSFCIGLENSPDLKAAKEVADFLGTIHHSFTFTIQEGLDAISDVIYHLETFDTTTIRAATPMFIMARKIKALGVKMVLSGEGSDEIMAGYLYFHKAPNPLELHQETVRKLKDLYLFDCLRANKSTSAWGVEARVPFLDKEFLDVAMNLNPIHKMCKDPITNENRMEKYFLRKAFDTPENPFLPDNVLWRQKEQFSDGVGYGWIDGIRDFCDKEITDNMLKNSKFLFPENTPMTKESYYFRKVFLSHFPQHSAEKTVPSGPSIACSSSAAIKWSKEFEAIANASNGECSGRAVAGVHNSAYEDTIAETVGNKRKRNVANGSSSNGTSRKKK